MHYEKRGIAIGPRTLSWEGWIGRVQAAGLNVLILHTATNRLAAFVQSSDGRQFLSEVRRAGIELEYHIHILSDLLPRDLFDAHPEYFRMAQDGKRTADANLCVSNRATLAIVAENAIRHETLFAGTTGRNYFWADDNKSWCHCPSCAELACSDQNLIYTNALAEALASVRPSAQAACLAYANSLAAPTKVKPRENVFLQFAPVYRCYEHALDDCQCEKNRQHNQDLQDLLAVFGKKNAEVLEYWLDPAPLSDWKRPAVKLPFSRDGLKADLAFYAKAGFRRVATFGNWLDQDYVMRHGIPPVQEFGEAVCIA